MIRTIRGNIYHENDGKVIVETASGLGFEIILPINSNFYKESEGSEVKVYTSMIVRENDVTLCGFSDRDSLELFEKLITVNGVGPKAAMSIIGLMPLNQLKFSISAGDSKAIAKAVGVGKKTAERVILELKDKLGQVDESAGTGMISEDVFVSDNQRDEAVAALISLGYSKAEATAAIGKISEKGLSSEEYIKAALKNLF